MRLRTASTLDNSNGLAVPINYGIWQFAQEKELAQPVLAVLDGSSSAWKKISMQR